MIDRKTFFASAWIQRNFECVLLGKFELSRIALHQRRPIGFLIASRYGRRHAHIHRLAVLSRFRREGIGAKLLKRFEDACLSAGITEITLESLDDRVDANNFYERMGFMRTSGERLLRYLKRKKKTEIAQRYSEISPLGNVRVYSKNLTLKLQG